MRSDRSRVFLCPHCRKPYIKISALFRYCTPECLRAAKQLAATCDWVERKVLQRGAPETVELDAPRATKQVTPKPAPIALPVQTEVGVTKIVWQGRRVKAPRNRAVLTPLERAKRGAAYRLQWEEEKATIVAALNKIKLDSGCVDCGYREHPTALQFDHVRGVKIKAVSQFSNLKAALAEAAKCEVRCAICHSIKTVNWKREQREARIARDLTILAEAARESMP